METDGSGMKKRPAPSALRSGEADCPIDLGILQSRLALAILGGFAGQAG